MKKYLRKKKKIFLLMLSAKTDVNLSARELFF